MHVFTKILKSAFALLMLFACGVCWWHLSPRWTSFECMHNLDNVVALLQALVFTIHSDKSQLITTQKMTLFSFCNRLNNDTKIKWNWTNENIYYLWRRDYSVIKIDTLLGNIVAPLEAVPFDPLHYRNIELWEIVDLNSAKGNLGCKMSISRVS